ncbi:hypothetical protein TD95_002626 [Thielaviopsis punctulata]|uniref:Thiamine pyrophosphokinase n=1 Tax=Thielaviopsis punctulata TaxID=72032 RepID=A0A0F4ZL08_9PEZI|nr:hypothetical protein TD95_002626 [Thielaviopsis punctulata]
MSSESPTQWDIVGMLKAPSAGAKKAALIILNQPIVHTPLFESVFSNCKVRVAADGGGTRMHQLALQTKTDNDSLDVIIGDLDSITPEALEYYSSTSKPAKIIKDGDEYSTDFGKAIKLVRGMNAQDPYDIIAFGGCGGRVDQGIGQLHQLYLFHDSSSRLFLLDNDSLTFLLSPGKHVIKVKDGNEPVFGKYVGILPMDGTSHITTSGLQWDVSNWKTSFSGQVSTNNHVRPETTHVEVESDRAVLFTISLREQ